MNSNYDDSFPTVEEFCENLKNTENCKHFTLKHIFEGEVNPKGYAVGYHSEAFEYSHSYIIEYFRRKEDKDKIYAGAVVIKTTHKTSNEGESTFFPKKWSGQTLVDKLNEAYNNRFLHSGNLYLGETKDGILINLYIDEEDDKIISAFPMYGERKGEGDNND